VVVRPAINLRVVTKLAHEMYWGRFWLTKLSKPRRKRVDGRWRHHLGFWPCSCNLIVHDVNLLLYSFDLFCQFLQLVLLHSACHFFAHFVVLKESRLLGNSDGSLEIAADEVGGVIEASGAGQDAVEFVTDYFLVIQELIALEL